MCGMEHKIVYLTGPPASGKTSISQVLHESYGAQVFSYGALLTERLVPVQGQEELRRRSAGLVTSSMVEDLDIELAQRISESTADLVVIDSHAVTKEEWGFRAIPYSPATLSNLGVTHIVCLYAPTKVVAVRIAESSGGRPLPSPYEVDMHQALQGSLALTYSHTLGVPIFFVANEAALAVAAGSVASCLGLATQR